MERLYEVSCRDCGIVKKLAAWRIREFGERGYGCRACATKKRWRELSSADYDAQISSLHAGRDLFHSEASEQQLSDMGKYARSKSTKKGRAAGRVKQHNTIKSSPKKYKEYCDKRKKIAIEFHDHLNNNLKIKEAHYRKVLKNKGSSKECADFLIELIDNGVDLVEEVYINGFFVDALLVGSETIVEYYGDTFHCNPKIYKDPDQICSWLGGRTVAQQWKRDERRLACFHRLGYHVIVVWSSDWNTDKNLIVEIIKNESY